MKNAPLTSILFLVSLWNCWQVSLFKNFMSATSKPLFFKYYFVILWYIILNLLGLSSFGMTSILDLLIICIILIQLCYDRKNYISNQLKQPYWQLPNRCHKQKLACCFIFLENARTLVVMPVYKKESRNNKINYRSINLLNVLSMVYDRFVNDTLIIHLNMYFSKFISTYRKNYSSNYVILSLIEDRRHKHDEEDLVGAVNRPVTSFWLHPTRPPYSKVTCIRGW